MKAGIIGARNLIINMEEYLPPGITEIITGSNDEISCCAVYYARKKGIKVTRFLSNMYCYGSDAEHILLRNIISFSEKIFVFRNRDDNCENAVRCAQEKGKTVEIIKI